MGSILPLERSRSSLASRLRRLGVAEPDPVEACGVLLESGGSADEVARLALEGADEAVRVGALVAIATVASHPAVPESVRADFRRAAGEAWAGAFGSKSLRPAEREALRRALHLFGLAPLGEDPEALPALLGRLPLELAAEMSGSGPAGVEEVLCRWRLIPSVIEGRPRVTREEIAGGLACATEAATEVPGAGPLLAAVAVAAALEAGLEGASVCDALDRIAAAGTPLAAWCLEEISRWPGAGSGVGSPGFRAARLAAGLRERGVVPRPHGEWRLRSVRVTAVDAAGNRHLTLVAEGEGASEVELVVLLDEEEGIVDLVTHVEEGDEGFDGDGSESEDDDAFEDEEADAGEEDDSGVCPCGEDHDADREDDDGGRPWEAGGGARVDLDFARAVLGDALHRHAVSGRPVPAALLLHRPLFGAAPPEAAPRDPDPGIPDPEAPESGKGTGGLADREPYRRLGFLSPAVFDFVRAGRERASLGPRQRLRIDRRLLAAFHREVLPGERAGLLRRLDHALELEGLRPGGPGPAAVVAARVRRAVASGGVPLERIPFVAVVARRSLEEVDRNLRAGFRSRREAVRSDLEEARAADARAAERLRELAWSGALAAGGLLSRWEVDDEEEGFYDDFDEESEGDLDGDPADLDLFRPPPPKSS